MAEDNEQRAQESLAQVSVIHGHLRLRWVLVSRLGLHYTQKRARLRVLAVTQAPSSWTGKEPRSAPRGRLRRSGLRPFKGPDLLPGYWFVTDASAVGMPDFSASFTASTAKRFEPSVFTICSLRSC